MRSLLCGPSYSPDPKLAQKNRFIGIVTIAVYHEFEMQITLIYVREAINENHTRLGPADKAVSVRGVVDLIQPVYRERAVRNNYLVERNGHV